MKPLYYLEVAKSVNDDLSLVPAKKMKWHVSPQLCMAYEDEDLCLLERIRLQASLQRYVIRVKRASWLKNLSIRFDDKVNGDWIIVNSIY